MIVLKFSKGFKEMTQKNIQTGNAYGVVNFDDGGTIAYVEYLGCGQFLNVVFNSGKDSYMFWQSENDLVTDCLGDQSCLDDCLELISANEIIPGWHCPQTLGL
jgi:hypothetical protein